MFIRFHYNVYNLGTIIKVFSLFNYRLFIIMKYDYWYSMIENILYLDRYLL